MTKLMHHLREAADKSLARRGRKQATATNHGNYSSYSLRSSIHFLERCSNLCKSLKQIQNVVSPTRSLRQQWPSRRKKNSDTIIVFFQPREQVVVRRGQIRRIVRVIKTLEAQVDQFLLCCKCSVRRGIVVHEQDHLGELPLAFFLQNVLQFHQQRWVILRVDILALWKIINMEVGLMTFQHSFLCGVDEMYRSSLSLYFILWIER
jgi:hypothetical protein